MPLWKRLLIKPALEELPQRQAIFRRRELLNFEVKGVESVVEGCDEKERKCVSHVMVARNYYLMNVYALVEAQEGHHGMESTCTLEWRGDAMRDKGLHHRQGSELPLHSLRNLPSRRSTCFGDECKSGSSILALLQS